MCQCAVNYMSSFQNYLQETINYRNNAGSVDSEKTKIDNHICLLNYDATEPSTIIRRLLQILAKYDSTASEFSKI